MYALSMRKLLYVSATKRDFPQQELREILATARRNNAARGITGLLLYADGGFLQVLEGEHDPLFQLYAVIERDGRHWDTKLLLDIDAPRNFSKWSMGFEALDENADPDVLGVTQAAIQGVIQPGGAHAVLDILIRTFQSVQGIE